MAEPVVIEIRGVVYPSCRAAAKALGVNHSTVSRHLDRGTLDKLGKNADDL
jgi:IS30 family transposase